METLFVTTGFAALGGIVFWLIAGRYWGKVKSIGHFKIDQHTGDESMGSYSAYPLSRRLFSPADTLNGRIGVQCTQGVIRTRSGHGKERN